MVAFSFCFVNVEAQRHIKVNGYEVIKKVKEITFEDSQVLLKWNDNTVSQDFFSRMVSNIAYNDDVNELDIFAICGLQGEKMTVEGFTRGSVIYVYDLLGRIVKKQKVDCARAVLSLNNLSTGVYILKNNHTYMRFAKVWPI